MENAASGAAEHALADPKAFYDERYRFGYMQDFEDLFEACRLYTIRKTLELLKRRSWAPATILDYGCGEGRYVGELRKQFPHADICGCDISDIGLDIARRENPDSTFIQMSDETIDHAPDSFDLVISVEVLEHVADVEKSIAEIAKVLKPGGLAIITTPCANPFSAEWFKMAIKRGFEPSDDLYGRFASDEPAHLRRLTDAHLKTLFERHGVTVKKVYHRTHLFTTIVELRVLRGRLSKGVSRSLALLDWHLFKHLPNGATMLALCVKRP